MDNSPFKIYATEAKQILSRTSGFIAQAGFTHSLTPAHNCTFNCPYCYVDSIRFFAGLKKGERWGSRATFKVNAPELLPRELRPNQVIYCSPLTDPYQPGEREKAVMPGILSAVLDTPPEVFSIQTRSSLILRDLVWLQKLARRTRLRVSFSITTNREQIRRWYEPLCSPIAERLEVVRRLNDLGIETYVTIAPILPCDPVELVNVALQASGRDLIGDPLHVREAKPHGAVTREGAERISEKRGFLQWHDPGFMAGIIATMKTAAAKSGHRFEIGPSAFGWLAARS